MKIRLYGDEFYGNKLSEHAIKHGRVDYAALGKSVNHIYHNTILNMADDWEAISGSEVDDDGSPVEIMQTYIVDHNGAELLKEFEELVYWSNSLEMYVWAILHWGTEWDYVLTNIEIERCDNE